MLREIDLGTQRQNFSDVTSLIIQYWFAMQGNASQHTVGATQY